MRPLSKLALGGGTVSAATAAALIAGGVFATTATLVVTDPLAPKASADSLRRFDDCSSLLRWYVDHGVPRGRPVRVERTGHVRDRGARRGRARGRRGHERIGAESSMSSTDARASSSTGTNTQEADVDEPDLAKTDGRRVVRLVDQRVVAVSDVTGAEPRELGRISLPADAYGGELLLAGDHVLVSESSGGWIGGPGPIPMPMDDGATYRRIAPIMGTRVIDVDISDPAHPRIVHDDTYSGTEVSMRQYGDVVRLVTSTSRPELRWATPRPGRSKGSEDRALRRNRALVRATTIEDWVPTVVDNLAHDGAHAAARLLGRLPPAEPGPAARPPP